MMKRNWRFLKRSLKRFLKNILGEKALRFLISIRVKLFSESEEDSLARRKKFYSSFIKKGDLCFDVGSNLGNRIDPLLQIEAKVLAVEPQKSCYEFLTSKYGNRIILVTKGLGDKEEVKQFYISNVSTNSSFSEEWINAVKAERFKEYRWDDVTEIEMTTLDKLILEYGVPVFIKIDVEGYELEVLKGLNTPINLISFEYTTPEQTAKAIDCITQIQMVNKNIECNYSIGDSMEFELKSWLPVNQMKEHILSKYFINTAFGDIYVRTKESDNFGE
jgi:FkbM family methyltransferase